MQKRLPHFFHFSNERIEKIEKMFETGFCYFLPERDPNGCRVLLVQYQKVDFDTFTRYDAMGLISAITATVLEEEETQIAGSVVIINCKDQTLKSIYTPLEFKDLMSFLKSCLPGRLKVAYFINLPSVIHSFFEMCRSLIGPKLSSKIFSLRNENELSSHFDIALLPKELGGIKNETEMMANTKAIWDARKDKLMEIFQNKIDWKLVAEDVIRSSSENESTGSFRKLEID